MMLQSVIQIGQGNIDLNCHSANGSLLVRAIAKSLHFKAWRGFVGAHSCPHGGSTCWWAHCVCLLLNLVSNLANNLAINYVCLGELSDHAPLSSFRLLLKYGHADVQSDLHAEFFSVGSALPLHSHATHHHVFHRFSEATIILEILGWSNFMLNNQRICWILFLHLKLWWRILYLYWQLKMYYCVNGFAYHYCCTHWTEIGHLSGNKGHVL